MLALSSFIPCFAVGGAVPVRIPLSDGSKPRCIDSSKDKIWFTLRRVVTTRSRHWFTQDNSVAAIVTATVKTDPQPAKPILFPLMTEATLRDFAMGQISVPIEYTIVDGLNLKQGNVTYTGIGIEVTLLNRRGKNAWGSALAALDEITKKLPIPASPFTQSATYLMDFANSAVTKDLDGQQSDDKVKSAALALNFDPTGSCAGPGQDGSDFETTGTIAVLQEGGLAGPGYVEISRTNEYCWSAELRPAFVLSAAPKVSGVACTDSRYKDRYKQVTNNYVGFFLNAIGSTRVLGAAPARDREDSLNRCIANGIDRAQCLN
jgi:hypothetical protein